MDSSPSIPLQKIKTNRYLPILLSFILIDEACNNYIFNLFIRETRLEEFIFYITFLVLQIIASPIQAGYSDFYCRKKSLAISLFASTTSLSIAYFSDHRMLLSVTLLSTLVLIKGVLGNTLPMAWAAIADTQTRNFRFSLGLSTSAIALGYLVLIVVDKIFPGAHSNLAIIIIYIILIFLCLARFKDVRDKNTEPPSSKQKNTISNEIKMIINNYLKSRRMRKALLAFMLWEFSFYTTHMLDVDLRIKQFQNLTTTMILGYLVGVLILKFSKKSDEELIKIGYYISIAGPLPIFILTPIIGYLKIFMIPCYFTYSLGFAFLVPSLFSILSSERGPHEQGKIYGLIDSTDTIAFLFASISAMLYNFLQLSPLFVFAFSFVVFLTSWLPYAEFKKTKPENR